MSRTKLFVLLAAVLIAGAAGGYWLAHRSILQSSPESTTAGSSAKTRVLYWHDPMVPNVKFDKPGKSPYMDMQLVPVYADEGTNDAAVRVSPTVAQNLGIRLGKVETAVLRPNLRAIGNVAFDENAVEVVQARVEGYVTRLHVRAPLVHVRKGEPLADIVAPTWLSAQQEYIALLDAKSTRGQSIRDAARERLLVLGVPESVVRDIEARRQIQATTTLVAPTDGIVTELAVREGSTFMPGAPLFRINGVDTVWVIAQVPESQVSLVPMGAEIAARTNAWPGEVFPGKIIALLPDIDQQSRTLPVRISVRNTGQKLAAGMFVSLDIAGPGSKPQLVVPSEAVIITGERSVVILAREQGGFDVADVKTGSEVDGKTAIRSGLEAGQSIVLSGQFLIDSEASLRSTLSRLTTGTAPAEPRP